MRFIARVDGADHVVVAAPDGSVAVDGEKFDARLTKKGATQYSIVVGDRTYEVRLVEGATGEGELLIEVAGERVRVTVGDLQAGGAGALGAPRPAVGGAADPAGGATAKPAARAVGDVVIAPMPGKVLEVFVEPGDEVDAEDVVLILEAMKMENELHVPRKGRVKAVHVKKGDPVSSQQVLVELE